jgi:antitoxin component YwqK of YwqJK toxin-antitoxin module
MKYCLSVIVFIVVALNISGQIVRVENAKYFDTKHNLYNGKYEEFYDNGNNKLVMFLKNGEQDSTTLLYFEDGKINEIRSYKNGLRHGKWETYNSKGQKLAEAWYRNDKKDGIWRIWDENGILRYKMPYSNDERIGEWFIYNEKGEILDQKIFE